jgi:glycerol uptake facilitator protein
VLGVPAIVGNFNAKVMTDTPLRTAFSTAFPPLLVGFLVWGIGPSLGGPTGYAINPARDLGPRIKHPLLPIPGKHNSDWGYGWIPVVGPIIAGILGAVCYQASFPQ